MPKLSILVPVYNVEEYLSQCIESILSQTYTNFELIIVDDGSTDNGGNICDEYAKKDTRIKVIHQKNQGLVAARKSGLNIASGEYIGFVDSDDYIDSRMYEVLMREITVSKADFVHTGLIQKGRKRCNFEKKLFDIKDSKDSRCNFLIDAVMGEQAFIWPSIFSKIFTRDLILKCYVKVPNECSYGEDLINLCRCVLEADKILTLPEALYYYRTRENSLSHSYNAEMIQNEVRLYDALKDVLLEYEIYDRLKNEIDARLKNNIIHMVYHLKTNPFQMILYRYPEPETLMNKRIVLYGAGEIGRAYYAQISRYQSSKIVAWVDRSRVKPPDMDIEIKPIDVLKDVEYDCVLIAINNEKVVKEVKAFLLSIGISESKILWRKAQAGL